MHRPHFSLTLAALLLGALALCMPARLIAAEQTITSHDVPEAETYVQGVANQVTDVLASSRSEPDKEQAIRAMIDSDLDGEAIAKYTLGKLWRQATPEEFSQFVGLLKQYASGFYQGRLNEYSGAKLKVSGSIANGLKAVVVGSAVEKLKNGDPVYLDWLVIRSGSSFKLIDFRVAGVWIARSWGDQFASIIDKNGGKFQALNDHLKQQITTGAKEIK